jgi:hypothetical protein
MTTPLNQKRSRSLVGGLIPESSRTTRATVEGGSREGHFYRPLPKEFRHNGFDYRQIYRQGDLAIYRQTWKGNEHSAAFEVIRVKRREAFQVEGRLIEPAEVYPNSEAWGTDGFTFADKDAAFAKLRGLRKGQ